MHEAGHQLFDGSHYGGQNLAVGNYFYLQNAGWGQMNLSSNKPFNVANAWEKFFLGWVRIVICQLEQKI